MTRFQRWLVVSLSVALLSPLASQSAVAQEVYLRGQNIQPSYEGWIKNDDGSFDLYFGPKAPQGKEANWIQTVPKKGWFCLLRLYSPTEAWYDKTWRPGEIELIE